MPIAHFVHAPGLLTLASHALGKTQATFGEMFGVSRRTMMRWQHGQSGPLFEQWKDVVRWVYPVDRALSVRIADEIEESLESLGLEKPPPPPPAPPARPVPPMRDLVDSIVCAAADAIDATPGAVRPALVAAFDRVSSVGLSLEEVREALRPTQVNAGKGDARGKRAAPERSSGAKVRGG